MNSPLLLWSFTAALLFQTVSFAETKAAAKQVATFTQIEGKTQLFTRPSKIAYPEKSLKEGTMAFYEGDYYMIQPAKVSDSIPKGSIVRTLPGAHARIVYENGDQFYVGPGTSYRITWNDQTDLDANIQLLYGRLRGVISKEGPRKELKIRTKAATLGVRGTDFFIEDNGEKKGTEISVLRGAVEVTPTSGINQAKPTLVKTGMSATVAPAAIASSGIKSDKKPDEKEKIEKSELKVEVHTTSKEDLTAIQSASALPVTKPATEKLAQLEKKAIEVTVKDIELYQPGLFKKLVPDEMRSIQELNSKMVTLAQAEAPSVPTKMRKPKTTELKNSDEGDVYDKYFKIGE